MARDFRGATVEDLDPPPALCIYPDMTIGSALEISFEHSFSYLPVLNRQRRLLGYLTAEQLEKSDISATSLVKEHYNRFRTSKKRFVPITPETSLEELDAFFANDHPFAVITDSTQKFVLGVATHQDLDKFWQARPALK